ncbi:MAG: hypothetical protein AB1Z31_18025, partial [Desulfobacterales bacterium]
SSATGLVQNFDSFIANQTTSSSPIDLPYTHFPPPMVPQQARVQSVSPVPVSVGVPKPVVQNTGHVTFQSPIVTMPQFENNGYQKIASRPQISQNILPQDSTPHNNNRESIDFESESSVSYDEIAGIQFTQQVIRSIPRGLSFDGTGHWSTFKRKFLYWSDWLKLSEPDKLFCLIHCLSGDAGELFATVDERGGLLTFNTLMDMLEQAYGNIQTDLMSQQVFEHAVQSKNETLQQWADRIQRLGYQAFKALPSEYETLKVVDKFCSGLYHKEMMYDISLHRPKTLPEALQLAMFSETIFKNMLSEDKPSVSKVRYVSSEFEPSFDEFDGESDDEFSVRQVSKQPSRFRNQPHHPQKPQENNDATLLEILKLLQQLNFDPSTSQMSDCSSTAAVAPWSSRNMETQTEENLQYKCFECQSPSHFRSECPSLKADLNK